MIEHPPRHLPSFAITSTTITVFIAFIVTTTAMVDINIFISISAAVTVSIAVVNNTNRCFLRRYCCTNFEMISTDYTAIQVSVRRNKYIF